MVSQNWGIYYLFHSAVLSLFQGHFLKHAKSFHAALESHPWRLKVLKNDLETNLGQPYSKLGLFMIGMVMNHCPCSV
jgi:hypothetical protein